MTTHFRADRASLRNATIATQADLLAFWELLLTPLGFTSPSLWVLLVEPDGTPVRQLLEIAEPPSTPDRSTVRMLAHLLQVISSAGMRDVRVAPLIARPGRATPLTPDDRAWAAACQRAAVRAGVPCDIVHLAADDAVVPIPLDEYLPAAS